MPPSSASDGVGTSPWRLRTIGAWVVTRLVLFLNVVVLHHPCDYVFWQYGHRFVALHLVPYRDFPIEYPPLATALFLIPGWARDYATYAAAFAVVMLVFDAATVLVVRAAGVGLGMWRDGWAAAFCYTILGAVSGSILPKFDLIPGMLTLAAIVLLVRGRDGAAWIALAAAVLFKGYAVVLIPLFLLYRVRTRGASGWWRGPAAGAAVSALVVAPLLVMAGLRGLAGPLYHAKRGLEIESVYASIVLVAHHLVQLPVQVSPRTVIISRDVFSPLNGPLLALLPWVLALGLAATYVAAWFRLRRDPTPDALLILSLAAVTAFIISFKALPSHYLLWLCPMAAVALGRAEARFRPANVALWTALVLGAIIPEVWDPLRRLDVVATAVMVGRNTAIVALFLSLVRRAWLRPLASVNRSPMAAPSRRTAVSGPLSSP